MVHPRDLPVSLLPQRIGMTSRSADNPMRRLKKNLNSGTPPPGPKSKMLPPSTKNSRFSGNKTGKRVRFRTWASTSVSAKSVFTVKSAVKSEVIRYFKSSSPMSERLCGSAFAPRSGEICVTAVFANGLMRIVNPRSRSARPVNTPAYETCLKSKPRR